MHVASLVCLVVKTLAWPDSWVKLKYYLVSYVITTHTDTPELMDHTHLTGILLKCALYYRCGMVDWHGHSKKALHRLYMYIIHVKCSKLGTQIALNLIHSLLL